MKKMKTFWMDSNLSKLIQNLFPNQNQGEFIRKSVEQSMERALKRIWNPIGYVSRVSNHFDGTYCFKYYYGFYPKLNRQFIFIQEIDGSLFFNALPTSRDDLFHELSITPGEDVDILFLGYYKTIFVSQDEDKQLWNVLVRCSDGSSRGIDIEYKAFVENYVGRIKSNIANYNELRYYGVKKSLGFPVDYDFQNHEEDHLKKLSGHKEIVHLPDEYKRPNIEPVLNVSELHSLNKSILGNECSLENELFKCSFYYSYSFSIKEPSLYFRFNFKKNNVTIYPPYSRWLSFCDGITNTIVCSSGRLNSVNFDSIYAVTDYQYCIIRGLKLDMSMTVDNVKLCEFINQYLELPEYKKLISNYELAKKTWEEKYGKKD